MKNAGTVVVADDLKANLDLLSALLLRDGYTVHTADNGATALELVRQQQPDLVLSDVLMPKLDGFDLCRQLKSADATRLIPVVLVTSLGESEDRIRGIEAGADDFVTKPVNAAELRARVRSLVRLKRFTDELDSAESVILSLALTVEARDPYTAGHCERLATYAAAFGAHLSLQDEELAALRRGGYLHDVGKIGVADAILSKPTKLTPEEYETMKQHTVIGDSLCGSLRLLRLVRPIVRHHHERADGSGYPDGLAGDEIPLLAQIMSIVDVYDALTSDRCYRKAMSPEDAFVELRKEADRGWRRRDLVDEYVAMHNSGHMAELLG